MSVDRDDGIRLARRRIAAFMVQMYSTDTALEELPQELVHSFDIITDLLRMEKDINYYTFAQWWLVAKGMTTPEDFLR